MIAALAAQQVVLLLIPARKDNYIYLLHDSISGFTAAIDPSDAAPVLEALSAQGWQLNAILATHHHGDHVGGIAELKEATHCCVYGYAGDAHRIPDIDFLLEDGESVTLGRFGAEVLFIPGHTLGHIAYYIPQLALLFCGDTLFSLGCGRLFEGTPQQMFDALNRLKALPDTTWVCCGHEYTQANARFALSVDPNNALLQKKSEYVERLRAENLPTLPCLLAEEKACNPFLRCENLEAFAQLRKAKDTF